MRSFLTALLLLSTFLSAGPAKNKNLFVLKSGKELYGYVVLKQRASLFVKTADSIEQVQHSQIKERIPEQAIPGEFQRRLSTLNKNADAHCRLALWCEKVGLPREALKLFKSTLKLDPHHQAAKKHLASLKARDLFQVPWKAEEKVTLFIEAKKVKGKKWVQDKEAKSAFKQILEGGKNRFSIVVREKKRKEADYILRILRGAKVKSENRFYGEVLLSRTWLGVGRLYVLDKKTGRKQFVLEPVKNQYVASAHDKNGEKVVLSRALQALIKKVRSHPGFRVPDSPEPSSPLLPNGAIHKDT